MASFRACGRFLILCLLFVSGAAARADERVHFVIDIDSTILYGRPFSDEEAKADGGKFVRDVDGLWHRLSDGTGEFLIALSRIPGARVSFWSNRPLAQIHNILHQVQIPSGGDALDLVERTDGGVFCHDDVVDTEKKGNKRFQPRLKHFTGREKKALGTILKPGDSLERIFLIDDDRTYVAAGEEENHVQLPNFIGYNANPSEIAEERLSNDEPPGPHTKRFLYSPVHDRNKLVVALGLIQLALRHSQEQGISPVEALWNIQWKRTHEGWKYDRLEARNYAVYRAGLSGMRDVDADFSLTRLLLTPVCKRTLRLLSGR